MSRNRFSAFLVLVSIFGLAVVLASTFYPPLTSEDATFRKPLTGSLFGAICIAGIIAVFRPGPCSNAISCPGKSQRTVAPATEQSAKKKLNFRGHHPNCGNFTAHVLQIGGRTFCAGCAGLFLGGTLALIMSLAYFFTDLPLGQTSHLLLGVGAVGTSLGLLQPILIAVPWSYARTFVNAFFAFGTSLILIGADYIAQSIFIDIFLLILIIFWLFTKISLSRWGHGSTCRECQVSDCDLRGF